MIMMKVKRGPTWVLARRALTAGVGCLLARSSAKLGAADTIVKDTEPDRTTIKNPCRPT
jgi:hypothetical protein